MDREREGAGAGGKTQRKPVARAASGQWAADLGVLVCVSISVFVSSSFVWGWGGTRFWAERETKRKTTALGVLLLVSGSPCSSYDLGVEARLLSKLMGPMPIET